MPARGLQCVVGQEATQRGNARVVDEMRNVTTFMRGAQHVLRVGDIQTYRLDASELHTFRIAGAGVNAGATGEGFACEGKADAAIGTGDEDDGLVE
ncbi:hypothetical protein D3C71_1169200 [compost metagenome]